MLKISESIRLSTRFGGVLVQHIMYEDESGGVKGSQSKEGILVRASATPSNPPVVRVQSSCLFGEAFWATDCDCGDQLTLALDTIVKQNGLLVYLYEEGRGAGLLRKIEAIRLQQTLGYDTDRAFECLSLETDLRTYRAASEVLKAVLGDSPQIILLSNNPSKRRGLCTHGVNVSEMRPLIPENLSVRVRSYLQKKAERLGHIMPQDILTDRADLTL
jgi:GTP cyclohydrolase II